MKHPNAWFFLSAGTVWAHLCLATESKIPLRIPISDEARNQVCDQELSKYGNGKLGQGPEESSLERDLTSCASVTEKTADLRLVRERVVGEQEIRAFAAKNGGIYFAKRFLHKKYLHRLSLIAGNNTLIGGGVLDLEIGEEEGLPVLYALSAPYARDEGEKPVQRILVFRLAYHPDGSKDLIENFGGNIVPSRTLNLPEGDGPFLSISVDAMIYVLGKRLLVYPLSAKSDGVSVAPEPETRVSFKDSESPVQLAVNASSETAYVLLRDSGGTSRIAVLKALSGRLPEVATLMVDSEINFTLSTRAQAERSSLLILSPDGTCRAYDLSVPLSVTEQLFPDSIQSRLLNPDPSDCS